MSEEVRYGASDLLAEIEDSITEIELTAELLISDNSTNESQARGQGMHTAANRLRSRIRNIRRGENL